MTPTCTTTTLFRALGLVCGLVLAAEIAVAESHEAPKVDWDRAKVTAIAESLAIHADALYDTFYKAPDATFGTGQARAFYDLKNRLRRLRIEARHLTSELSDGKGEVETWPTYTHMGQLFTDARILARKIFVWKQLKTAAGKVRDDLNTLAPFYGGRQFEPLQL